MMCLPFLELQGFPRQIGLHSEPQLLTHKTITIDHSSVDSSPGVKITVKTVIKGTKGEGELITIGSITPFIMEICTII